MSTTMREHWNQVRGWAQMNAREIIAALGMVAVGICGYEFGFTQGIRHTSPPIVIERATVAGVAESVSGNETTAVQGALNGKTTSAIPSLPNNCPFVGSRNSDKYHAAGCAVVKRIKPENRVCFTSEDDARAKRYQAGCLKP